MWATKTLPQAAAARDLQALLAAPVIRHQAPRDRLPPQAAATAITNNCSGNVDKDTAE